MSQRSSSPHTPSFHHACGTVDTRKQADCLPWDDSCGEAAGGIAVHRLASRPPPHDPTSSQIRVLGDLDDGNGLLQSVHTPEPTTPMSGLLTQFGNDVLVIFVAVQVWR